MTLTLLLYALLFASPAAMALLAQDADARGPASEKRGRNAAQRKIDQQLLYALYRARGEAEAKGVPESFVLLVKFDGKGRARVSIRARVTRALLAKIKTHGGEVISSSAAHGDVQALLPLESLEKVAALKEVRAVMPADEAADGGGATTND